MRVPSLCRPRIRLISRTLPLSYLTRLLRIPDFPPHFRLTMFLSVIVLIHLTYTSQITKISSIRPQMMIYPNPLLTPSHTSAMHHMPDLAVFRHDAICF